MTPEPVDPGMDDEDMIHLAGVVDGIGAITVHVTKNDSYSVGYQFQPMVRIYRPQGQEALLGKLVAYCEDEFVKHDIIELDGENDGTYKFTVRDTDSIRRFLEPLLPYLTARYEAAAIMLEEVLPVIEDGQPRDERGFYELMDAADALRANARHGPEAKYDKEYFEKEWREQLQASV